MDRGEDRETLRRLHEQTRAYIETGAGADRRSELRRLQRLHTNLPMMRDIVAANKRAVGRLDTDIVRLRRSISKAEAHLETLTQRRRFRRPDHDAINETQHQISAQQRYLERLETERARFAADLERSRRRLGETERAVARIPEVETAITRRTHWLLSHPAELAWEADLAARLAGGATATYPPVPDHDQTVAHDFEGALKPIDLRTIDLSATRPRTGIEHRLQEGRHSPAN